jgi:hypothetical protein
MVEWTHRFLSSAVVEGEWSVSLPGRFITEESASGTHWIGWVGLRSGLDDVEKKRGSSGPTIADSWR